MKNESAPKSGLMKMLGRIVSRQPGELYEPSTEVKGRKVTVDDIENPDPEIHSAARKLQEEAYKARYR